MGPARLPTVDPRASGVVLQESLDNLYFSVAPSGSGAFEGLLLSMLSSRRRQVR